MTAQNLTIGIVDHRALWSETLRQLRQNIAAVLSLMVLVLLAVVAIFAHQIATHLQSHCQLSQNIVRLSGEM